MPERPEKTCAACGRPFAWRRKWARDWERVKYCSDACRRANPDKAGGTDGRLEAAVLDLLAGRDRAATICPSEAARRVDPIGWRGLMEPARRAGRRLAARGLVEFTQGGRTVNPSTARGPVRIRLAR